MEANISLTPLLVKLNVQRGVMRRESQARRHIVVGAGLVRKRVVFLDRKLVAHIEPVVGRDLGHIPDGEAVRVPIVLGLHRAVQEAKEVELLAGVVLVDVLPVARHAVHAVLNAVDAARHGVLPDADRVAQTPAEDGAIRVEVVDLGGRGEVGDVEGPDLRQAAREHGRLRHVDLGASARDHKTALHLLRHQERARDEVVVAHAIDDGTRGGTDGAAFRVVLPGKDGLDGGGVESPAVVRERQAMVELDRAQSASLLPHARSSDTYRRLADQHGRLCLGKTCASSIGELVTRDALAALYHQQRAGAVELDTPGLRQTAEDKLGLPPAVHSWQRVRWHEDLRTALS